MAGEHATTFTLAGAGAADAAAGRAAAASAAVISARRMRLVNARRAPKLRERGLTPLALGLAPARTGCAAAEALDAPTGVHELLTARVEGMAVRADLDVQLRLRGPRPELVAAGAANMRGDVLGMNVCLHCSYKSSHRPPKRRRNQPRSRVHQVLGRPKRAGGGCLARTSATQSSTGRVPSISRASAEVTGASTPARSIACASTGTVSSASTAWPTRSGISAAGTPSASSSPALRFRDIGASAVATRSPVPARPTNVRAWPPLDEDSASTSRKMSAAAMPAALRPWAWVAPTATAAAFFATPASSTPTGSSDTSHTTPALWNVSATRWARASERDA